MFTFWACCFSAHIRIKVYFSASSPRPASFVVFTQKKGEKTYCFIQFSLRTMIRVTIAIRNGHTMVTFFTSTIKKISNTALKSIAERQRCPASVADKQSSFLELNAASHSL